MQAIALLVTLLLPILLIYFIRYENKNGSSLSSAKKKKKPKKKSSKLIDSRQSPTPAVSDVKDAQDRETKVAAMLTKPKDKVEEKESVKKNDKSKKNVNPIAENIDAAAEPENKATLSFVEERTKKAAKDSEVSGMAIDQHMDNTHRFSRVMRIKTEEPPVEQEWEPVEPGWNRKATKGKCHLASMSQCSYNQKCINLISSQSEAHL
jgi:hypothetical protein